MKNRTPVSLFPFLSVLLSTMGVLSFLAVTFLLFSRADIAPEQPPVPVHVQWVGAPAYVRPLLVECRSDRIVFHPRDGAPTRGFTRASLQRELGIVRELQDTAQAQLGQMPSRTQLWLYFKALIPHEQRLQGSFTKLMHEIEIDNLSGRSRRAQAQRYPILLIYPDGIDTYELASYLVETTTRLALGLEPMLHGWALPYSNQSS